MSTLLRKLFWVGLFLVFTLGFVTLFDHGYVTNKQFSADAKSEVAELRLMWKPVTPAKDKTEDLNK